MTSSERARDAFTLQVRDTLFAETPSLAEQATLARIRQRLDFEIELGSTRATDHPESLRRTARRSRGRVAAIALAAIIAITIAAVAAAQSDMVRDFFTKDTPSARRMEAFRVTPTLSGLDQPATAAIPPEVHERLEQLFQAHPDAATSRFGTLNPRDTTRELLHGRWKGRSIAIYARATNQDKVCYTASLGIGVPTTATCFASYFDLDAPIKIGGTVNENPSSATSEIRLFGLAADEVTGVTIRCEDGTTSRALMGTNAVYWDNLSDESSPQYVDIHLTGNRTVTHPITRYVNPSPGD